MTSESSRRPARPPRRRLPPVRPLPSPWVRALWVLPLAVARVAGRADRFSTCARTPSSSAGSACWGVSLVQSRVGFVVDRRGAARIDSGRDWSAGAIALWLGDADRDARRRDARQLGSEPGVRARGLVAGLACICFGGSAATALPVVALASILAARAYPTRPAIAGALLGLGAGLMADAGWRMFCHFSEPAHVLSAHLARRDVGDRRRAGRRVGCWRSTRGKPAR